MDEKDIIHQTFKDLFAKLDVQATYDISKQDDSYSIVLETQDSGILIGYHGEVLDGLQLISSLMVSKKIGHFVRISLEVGDYKKNRSEYLEKLAMRMRERVMLEKREQTIVSLKPWERRVIHLLLQEDEDVVSESVGEGKERVLVIKPKN